MRSLQVMSLMTAVLAFSGGAARADEVVPAWQEPGYVMDEIVVIGRALTVTSPSPIGAPPELYLGERVVKARAPVQPPAHDRAR